MEEGRVDKWAGIPMGGCVEGRHPENIGQSQRDDASGRVSYQRVLWASDGIYI